MQKRPVSEIFYTAHFLRSYKKLPEILKKEIDAREKWLRHDRFDPRLKMHKLGGSQSGYWSFSITHTHRIICAFEDGGAATFIDIGDHDIYR